MELYSALRPDVLRAFVAQIASNILSLHMELLMSVSLLQTLKSTQAMADAMKGATKVGLVFQ